MPEANIKQNHVLVASFCVATLIALVVLYSKSGTYLYANLDNGNITKIEISLQPNDRTMPDPLSADNNDESNNQLFPKPKEPIQLQPACPPQDKTLELSALCAEFLFVKFKCKPDDIMNPAKHKIPKYYYQTTMKNNSNNDTQNAIVNYIIAALLLTSLGAALLEFYRAKCTPSSEKGRKGTSKAPISRKCSLADLTVLKHHRKELVRRESILNHHLEEEGTVQYQQRQSRRNSIRLPLRHT